MTTATSPRDDGGPAPGDHPRGLYVLFGAEMWERFSYYGMRSLLVLYLVNHLSWNRKSALDLYATYTGLVYLTPLLGGFLADRYLGQRKAIIVGAIVVSLGHFVLAVESLLYLGLGLVILGTGFFKPNISTMVGQLYPPGDARRDAGYTIFYMGINVGAGISPLICGWLGEKANWHYGFAAAGVGMVLGLINFSFWQGALGSSGLAPGESGELRRVRPIDWAHSVLISLAGVGCVYAAVALAPSIARRAPRLAVALAPSIARWAPRLSTPLVLGFWTLLAFGLILFTAAVNRFFLVKTPSSPGPDGLGDALLDVPSGPEKEDRDAPISFEGWQRVIVILVVAAISIVFWMGFEQAGGTLNLFADKRTDRHAFGYEYPASWFQSVNAIYIVAFAPLFSMLWMYLDRTRLRLNSAAKMGIGLVVIGVSFFIMYNADRSVGVSGKVGPQWLLVVYLFNTFGELCLSPIGLSLVNKLAPAKFASLMMAVWFFCTAIANYLAGKLESYLEGTNINLWTFLIFTSVVPGLLLLLLSPLLKKMSHGRL